MFPFKTIQEKKCLNGELITQNSAVMQKRLQSSWVSPLPNQSLTLSIIHVLQYAKAYFQLPYFENAISKI